MEKLFIYASVVGVVAGIVYWICKKEKSNNTASTPLDKKVDFEHRPQEEEISKNLNVEEEIYQAKNESVQAIYERHVEAGEIMKDVYSNIMEDFVEDFSGEKDANENHKNKEVIINSESVSVMKDIDLISDELDELLK